MQYLREIILILSSSIPGSHIEYWICQPLGDLIKWFEAHQNVEKRRAARQPKPTHYRRVGRR